MNESGDLFVAISSVCLTTKERLLIKFEGKADSFIV